MDDSDPAVEDSVPVRRLCKDRRRQRRCSIMGVVINGADTTNDGDASANNSDDPVFASGSTEVGLSRYHHPPNGQRLLLIRNEVPRR